MGNELTSGEVVGEYVHLERRSESRQLPVREIFHFHSGYPCFVMFVRKCSIDLSPRLWGPDDDGKVGLRRCRLYSPSNKNNSFQR